MYRGREIDLTSRAVFGSTGKKTPRVSAAFSRDPAFGRTPGDFENETALLREDDLDAPVLRLAHTWRRRYAQIVEAVTGNGHVTARYTQRGKTGRHGIGAPLGEPLVVGVRAGGVGVAVDLDLDRAARLVLLRRELDDFLTLRRDVILIPVEEDEEHFLSRWRRRGRRGRGRRRRRRHAELHRYAGHQIVRVVFAGKSAACAAVCSAGAMRERVSRRAVVGNRLVGGPQETIVEVKRDLGGEFEAKPRDRLIAEPPAAAVYQSAAEGLRRHG